MNAEELPPGICRITECGLADRGGADDELLSIIVLFDYPFDAVSLDEALFSLAAQDHEHLDIIVVLPDAGLEWHRRVENTLARQPWPKRTRLRVTSVSTLSIRVISAHLVNAGLNCAAGRYVALLHHQDLVYQHAYRVLIQQLQSAPIAFGGIRTATHAYGYRHWMVTGKVQAELGSARIGFVASRRGAIHAFVADRRQLEPDYLTVRQPDTRLAITVFLHRLAMHPRADFHAVDTRMFESRIPPGLPPDADLGRLLPVEEIVPMSAELAAAKPVSKGVTKPDYKSIPIFINARDLFTPLSRLVTWLLNAGYMSIHVIDNDSSYPPLLQFYHAMRKEIQVMRLGINMGQTALWDIKVLERLKISGPFVWTDPDVVPIEECPTNVLEFFWAVLRSYPHKTKVGFGLRIDDLPDHYRFKHKAIAWERQFWQRKLASNLYDASIDTTFALYRPGAGYDLLGIRTGFPYLARHTPWYENSDRPSADHVYYIDHARPEVYTWGGEALPCWIDADTQSQPGKMAVRLSRRY